MSLDNGSYIVWISSPDTAAARCFSEPINNCCFRKARRPLNAVEILDPEAGWMDDCKGLSSLWHTFSTQ